MRTSSTRPTIYAAIVLSFLSTIALSVNALVYQYPGNNYFPDYTSYIVLSLLLMYGGFLLQFGPTSRLAATLKEVLYFFLVMSVLALATNAVQYTPFYTIDKQILAFEASLHIDLKAIMSWTHTKPVFKELLAFIYDTLPYQMCYFPLILIATKRLQYIREYYFLLLLSTMIGFFFYYFFPTTGPASIIKSNYFSTDQLATGLKFLQIHQYIQPNTLEGGMIALPSFHVIWAWFCLYLLRGWPVAFFIMLPINLLLIASCVLLGWHYPTDILGSFVVIFIAHGLYCFFQKKPVFHSHQYPSPGLLP